VRTLIALAAAGALAGPPAALASTRQVQIPGRQFAPAQAVAIAGDSVTWTNRDFSSHNVAGDTFSSGPMARGDAFTHAFPVVGAFPYRCSIHLGMNGRVDVYHAYLAPPSGSVLHGRTVLLHGLAAEGSGVTIERVSDGAPVGTATAGGNKPLWIKQMFDYVEGHTWIRSVLWFDLPKQTDWRVATSPAAEHAYAEGVARMQRTAAPAAQRRVKRSSRRSPSIAPSLRPRSERRHALR